MTQPDLDTEQLIHRARGGDSDARQQLLARHRERLCRMVAARLDRRVAARLDPSDVVQDALMEAAQKLSDYLRDVPVPFYPWLRRLTWEHLLKLHQRHLTARKRSVLREQPVRLPLSHESVHELARRLVNHESSPSRRLLQAELRDRVQAALTRLPESDRELLALRYMERVSIRDMAAILGIQEGAVKMRHTRALDRLSRLLATDLKGDEP